MKYMDIDWSKLWENAMRRATGAASWSSSGSERGVKRWNEGAKILKDHIDYNMKFMNEEEYANKFINLMDFDSNSTVLDIGCGGGTLTIPLAKKVKQITALDISKVRIDQVKKKAELENLSNIKFICKNWRDISLINGINKHDIVIASRSLGMFDLHKELKKIDSVSNESVYISRIATSNDILRIGLHNIIDLKYTDLPSYIYVLNMLYQMDILVNVKFITCQRREFYENIEHALKIWMWRLGYPLNYEEQIKQYLLQNLIQNENGEMHTNTSEVKWALMFWRK